MSLGLGSGGDDGDDTVARGIVASRVSTTTGCKLMLVAAGLFLLAPRLRTRGQSTWSLRKAVRVHCARLFAEFARRDRLDAWRTPSSNTAARVFPVSRRRYLPRHRRRRRVYRSRLSG